MKIPWFHFSLILHFASLKHRMWNKSFTYYSSLRLHRVLSRLVVLTNKTVKHSILMCEVAFWMTLWLLLILWLNTFYEILNSDLSTTGTKLVYFDVFYHVEYISCIGFECELRLVFYVLSKLRTYSKTLFSTLDSHLYMATEHINIFSF